MYDNDKGILFTIFHEMPHFIFYDYCLTKYPRVFKNLDTEKGQFWEIAEMFNAVVQQTPTFTKTLRTLQENPTYSILQIARQFIKKDHLRPALIAKVIGLNRSSLYLQIKNEPSLAEQELTVLIFEIKRKHPNYGYRRVALHIKKKDIRVN